MAETIPEILVHMIEVIFILLSALEIYPTACFPLFATAFGSVF
jgi:hypothetical protein